jgi:hypothetical protein
MAKGSEVLSMLLPNGGWYIQGNEYENIKFIECEPITKEQFETGLAQYDAWKAEQDAAKAQAKAVLLERLGLTQEEFNTLTA